MHAPKHNLNRWMEANNVNLNLLCEMRAKTRAAATRTSFSDTMMSAQLSEKQQMWSYKGSHSKERNHKSRGDGARHKWEFYNPPVSWNKTQESNQKFTGSFTVIDTFFSPNSDTSYIFLTVVILVRLSLIADNSTHSFIFRHHSLWGWKTHFYVVHRLKLQLHNVTLCT